MDVAGDLQLTKIGIERFRTANPALVSRITYSLAPSPELPGKLKAQQQAGRVDIDLVLTGPGALSDGVVQGLWTPLLPDHAGALPDLGHLMHKGARMMQENFGKGQGVAVAYSPSGPLFEYAPDRVASVPRTAKGLLEWTRAHPNHFSYARPYNSGPGWTFLQGIPYVLGDADPQDPVHGWDKTWEYLAALGQNIDYYPGGTTAMMKELAESTRDIVVSTCGWDINPRVLGVVPKEMGVFMLVRHGKDVLMDKPGVTTEPDLVALEQAVAETGRIFSICFSERFLVPSTATALQLIRAGEIGRVVQTVGLGPHRLNAAIRPAWFFDPTAYGGILCDIASHQIDQFMTFTGSDDARIVASTIGVFDDPRRPGFENFGEILLRSASASGYCRVDWFTPDGLSTWGDGRLTVVGTEGTVELRKYIDVEGRPGSDHLFLANRAGTRHIACAGHKFGYFAAFAHDVVARTETAMR